MDGKLSAKVWRAAVGQEERMHLVADREGKITEENTMQDRLLERLYGCAAGRLLLKPLVRPWVSRMGGRLLDSGLSRFLIGPFIRGHAIDMAEYEPGDYASYNDFFMRRIRRDARRVESAPEAFVSPCDSRLCVYGIEKNRTFSIKHTRYTVGSLLRDGRLARDYAGGYLWVYRLCVEDYHRYIYVDQGRMSKIKRIPGLLHTVNPAANDHYPIYKENTREYGVLHSENFGPVLVMEVGALLVGEIRNHDRGERVRRGWEKGRFAFGGSTIILMTRKGAVRPDPDILKNSCQGIETKVRLGERVGVSSWRAR